MAIFYRTSVLHEDKSFATAIRPGTFSIAPFVAVFSSTQVPKFKFVLISVHLRGHNVVEELNILHGIYQQVVIKYRNTASAVILAGDFKYVLWVSSTRPTD